MSECMFVCLVRHFQQYFICEKVDFTHKTFCIWVGIPKYKCKTRNTASHLISPASNQSIFHAMRNSFYTIIDSSSLSFFLIQESEYLWTSKRDLSVNNTRLKWGRCNRCVACAHTIQLTLTSTCHNVHTNARCRRLTFLDMYMFS